ncbi:phosphotransferase family protein [Microlunatus soli]|uniref:Phosphotransferase enzyme family protein n=1 Tax=Microlunatus soli TaxID=630515 RepID=A0A1H1W121_9ACTN|nr:hypothetical protein [Microlunatus soli]SDS90705.1 hypothetical protein SAMN04489812_3442 [Microlunatus soli]
MPDPSPVMPLTTPTAGTAQRPSWGELPTAVRSWVQDQLGSAVIEGRSQRSGYTPGFASRLTLADGSPAFVKIMGWGHDYLLPSYRNEGEKRRRLPAGLAAPRLRCSDEARIAEQDWVLLIFDDIDGHPPRRPWDPDEARIAIETVEHNADLLTPAPADYPWLSITDELGGLSPDKEEAIDRLFGDHRSELRELVGSFGELCSGESLVHADLRDDNMLIGSDGSGWVCDWSFPVLGRSFIDLVTLLLSIRGDGLDADALLAASPLLTPADADGVDSLLADLMLYYVISAAKPGPDNSPYLRDHQRWNGKVAARWLADRRGWDPDR